MTHFLRNARERFAVVLANAAVDYVRRRVLCTEREREFFDALLRGELREFFDEFFDAMEEPPHKTSN